MNFSADSSSKTDLQARLRIAVLGASGIGKNHAGWFQKNNCDVVAFAGTTTESVAATRQVLQARLGSAPNGYTDVAQLLQAEKLDAVCISTPPNLHFEHAQLCFEHGLHILCEKPLVYDPNLASGVLQAHSQELVSQARERGVLLGTQMQYPFIAEKICEMANVSAPEIETFSVEMETKNWKPNRAFETYWIELAPHPLSVLQRLAGDAELDENSIACKIGEQETNATFQVRRADGSKITARLMVRFNPDTQAPLRRFSLNGVAIDCAGRKNENGDFLTYLSTSNDEIEMPDLVDILIGNFVAACRKVEPLFVTGEDGAQNVAWLLRILDRGERV